MRVGVCVLVRVLENKATKTYLPNSLLPEYQVFSTALQRKSRFPGRWLRLPNIPEKGDPREFWRLSFPILEV